MAMLSVMIDMSGENIELTAFKKSIKEGVKQAQTIIRSIKDLCARCGRPKRDISDVQILQDDAMEMLRRLKIT